MEDRELLEHVRTVVTRSPSPAIGLRDAIAELVDDGRLEHGRRLPTERNLAEALELSRVAVRQALEGLERRGTVTRRQGSGTYISSARIEGDLRLLRGLSDEISGGSGATSTRVLQFGFAMPEAAVQRELRIDAEAMAAVRLVRVRSIDGVASTYEVSWMPSAIAGPLLGTDLADRSLFRLLAETQGVHPDHANERLRVATLDGVEAHELGCEVGAPAFLVNRTTYDRTGTPIEYAETLLRGDRFCYSTTLEAPHRLPDAGEQLSRFETLAKDA